MFTKALFTAFALIGAQAINISHPQRVDSINSEFIATAMGSDDQGNGLAQISDMYLQSLRGSNNRGGGLAQISNMNSKSIRGSNNRLDEWNGGGLAQVEQINSNLIASTMNSDDKGDGLAQIGRFTPAVVEVEDENEQNSVENTMESEQWAESFTNEILVNNPTGFTDSEAIIKRP